MVRRKRKTQDKKFVIHSIPGGRAGGWQWNFREFAGPDGMSVVRQEIEIRGPDFRARFNAMLRQLALIHPLRRPYVAALTEGVWKGKGLIEIRIRLRNVQYRPIACYGPRPREITILTIGEERGGTFVPVEKELAKKAHERKRLINDDPTRAVEHEE